MKRHSILILILLFFGTALQGQSSERPWAVGAGAGIVNYYGDLSARFINIKESTPGYHAFIERALSSGIGLRLEYQGGSMEGNDRASYAFFTNDAGNNDDYGRSLNFRSEFHNLNLLMTFSLNNGRILSKRAPVSPYFLVGVGVGKFSVYGDLLSASGSRYYYWSDQTIRDRAEDDPQANLAEIIEQDGNFETNLASLDIETDYAERTVHFPAGIGLKFRLGKQFFFNLESRVIFTLTDYLDDVGGKPLRASYANDFTAYAADPAGMITGSRGNSRNNLRDVYTYHNASLVYTFPIRKSRFDGMEIQPIELVVERIDVPADTTAEPLAPAVEEAPFEEAPSAVGENELAAMIDSLLAARIPAQPQAPPTAPKYVVNAENVYIEPVYHYNYNQTTGTPPVPADAEVFDTTGVILPAATDSQQTPTPVPADTVTADSTSMPETIPADTLAQVDTLSGVEQLAAEETAVVDSLMSTVPADTTNVVAATEAFAAPTADSLAVDSLAPTEMELTPIDTTVMETEVDSVTTSNRIVLPEPATAVVAEVDTTISEDQPEAGEIREALAAWEQKWAEQERRQAYYRQQDSMRLADLQERILSALESQAVARMTPSDTLRESVPGDTVFQASVMQTLRQLEQQLNDLKANAQRGDTIYRKVVIDTSFAPAAPADTLQQAIVLEALRGLDAKLNGLEVRLSDGESARMQPVDSLDAAAQAEDSLYRNKLMTTLNDVQFQLADLRSANRVVTDSTGQNFVLQTDPKTAYQLRVMETRIATMDSILQELLVRTTPGAGTEAARQGGGEMDGVDATALMDSLRRMNNDQYREIRWAIDSLQIRNEPPSTDRYLLELMESLRDEISLIRAAADPYAISRDSLDDAYRNVSVYTPMTPAATGGQSAAQDSVIQALVAELDAVKRDLAARDSIAGTSPATVDTTAVNAKAESVEALLLEVLKKLDAKEAAPATSPDSIRTAALEAMILDLEAKLDQLSGDYAQWANEQKADTAEVRQEPAPTPTPVTPKVEALPEVSVYFKSGQMSIDPVYFAKLGKMAEHLEAHAGTKIELRGYADTVGNADFNLQLSKQRAESVRKVLILQMGVSPARIVVVPMGEEQGVDPSLAEFSRRVDVRILN